MKKFLSLLTSIIVIFTSISAYAVREQVSIDSLISSIQDITGYIPKYEIDSSSITIYWPNSTLFCYNTITSAENIYYIKPETNTVILESASKNKYSWYEKNTYIYWNGSENNVSLNNSKNLKFEINYYENYDLIAILYEGSLILVENEYFSKESTGFSISLEHFAQAVYNWEYYLATSE